MTLVPNETEQALNRQYDVYAAAREEYRKKIAEQAAEIERLRAALGLFACDCIESGDLCPSPQNCRNYIARVALEEGRT